MINRKKQLPGSMVKDWLNKEKVSRGPEIDYMEYSTNALAQAAYVTNAINAYGQTGGGTTPIGNTVTCFLDTWVIGAAGTVTKFYYYTTTANMNMKCKILRYVGANMVLVGESEFFPSVAGGATRILETPITGVQANDYIGWYISTAGNAGNMITAGGTHLYYVAGDLVNPTAAASFSDVTGYYSHTGVYVSQVNAYTESTIKNQGSYSLKGKADQTTSLNKTLTRTLSTTKDLTGVDTLKFDMRASRTGSNIKIGIHDSGGTTTETTPNITVADTWGGVEWDISAVDDANKDVIDSIIITIENADADNTFYIDNFYGEYDE